MVDYNENMKLVWYKSEEIEVVEEIKDNKSYHLYFHNIYDLVDLIKTNPKLAKELKNQLAMVDFKFGDDEKNGL